ncbi:MAG: hypothetical protein ACKO0N_11940 [Planctomycetota bacterium]
MRPVTRNLRADELSAWVNLVNLQASLPSEIVFPKPRNRNIALPG